MLPLRNREGRFIANRERFDTLERQQFQRPEFTTTRRESRAMTCVIRIGGCPMKGSTSAGFSVEHLAALQASTPITSDPVKYQQIGTSNETRVFFLGFFFSRFFLRESDEPRYRTFETMTALAWSKYGNMGLLQFSFPRHSPRTTPEQVRRQTCKSHPSIVKLRRSSPSISHLPPKTPRYPLAQLRANEP